MTDRTTFEGRLGARLVAHAAVVDRPIDSAMIAAAAVASRRRAGRTWTLPRIGRSGSRLVAPAVVWLALVALLVAMVAVGLLAGGRPVFPAVVQASLAPSSSPAASGAAIPIRPGEPWIVYATPSEDRTGGGLILVREDGTDRHEILARSGVRLDHPDWSRDGGRLAFETWIPEAADPALDRIDIWVADADGSNARRVTTCVPPCLQRAYPAWSPDGTRLALIRYDVLPDGTWGSSAVEILDLASGNIWVVAETDDGSTAYYNPRWSPFGDQLVVGIETYTDATQTRTTSAVIGMLGVHPDAIPKILSPPDLEARYPDWHPTDDRIIFQADPSDPDASTTDLYVIGADGAGLTNLTSLGSGLGAEMPTWTPDGLRITYSQQTGSQIKSATFIDADGSNVTSVSSDLAAAPRLRPTP